LLSAAHAHALPFHFNTSLFAQLRKSERLVAPSVPPPTSPPPDCAAIEVMSPPEMCASTCPPVHADFGEFPSLTLMITPSPLTRQPV
jgi:hypothetical protein